VTFTLTNDGNQLALVTNMTQYISDSVSSQKSTERRSTRQMSQRADEGDGRQTSVTTASSLTKWQQFVAFIRSATYFCLITCPIGMF